MADREARAKCWEHRDAYFDCLTRNDDKEASCSKEKAGFEKNCAASWVSGGYLNDELSFCLALLHFCACPRCQLSRTSA